MIKITWIPYISTDKGYKLLLQNNGVEVGEIIVLLSSVTGEIRADCSLISKKSRKRKYTKMLIEEIKDNAEIYFPKSKKIYFQNVTSRRDLKLIQAVCSDLEWHISDIFPEKHREMIVERGIKLPRKPPIKQLPDGSYSLPVSAVKETFKININQKSHG